jgi:hypothetical protein
VNSVVRLAGRGPILCRARARVGERLRQALVFPIAVVTAPPGYQQATVVGDALAHSGGAYRHVDIDAR